MSRPKNTEDQNVESFWSKVDRRGPGDCWNWLGWIQKEGYGKFCKGHNEYWLPHRFVFQLVNGPIPKRMLVCHSCDNRKCCNPKHLFLGTHKENTQDAIQKGRIKNPAAKLTSEQALSIRARYTPRHGVGKLAREFGVDPKHIWAIAHGKAWTQPHSPL